MRALQHRPVLSWTLLLAWAGLIFALSHQPSLDSGLGWIDLVLRKLAHMTEYAVLTLLAAAAFQTSRPLRRHWLVAATAFAVVYAISDEYHQSLIEGRHGTAVDVVIDSLGVAAASLLMQRRRTDRARP